MMLRRYVLLGVVKFDILIFGKTFEMIIPTMNKATRIYAYNNYITYNNTYYKTSLIKLNYKSLSS